MTLNLLYDIIDSTSEQKEYIIKVYIVYRHVYNGCDESKSLVKVIANLELTRVFIAKQEPETEDIWYTYETEEIEGF